LSPALQKLPLLVLPLRVLTLNVFHFPWFPQRPDRFPILCREMRSTLRQVDVFCFQEAFLPASISLCEGFHHTLGLGGTERSNPTGLIIAARHPLEVRTRVAFRGERLSEDKARPAPQKGLILATMRTPFGDVEVCNVHLSTGEALRKRKELGHLHDILNSHASANPLVLAGDFNFAHRSPLFDEAVELLGVQCASHGVGPTHGGPRMGIVAWPEPPMTIDHVFIRSGARITLAGENARVVYDTPLHDRFGREVHASDHNGVLVELHAAIA
jgi:endonuclease/exonuclease/phosphatase family metal-dependent hydrolase